MNFSEVLNSVSGGGGRWTAAVPDDWVNGRTVFGGLQVALVLRAMRALVPAQTPLRTLQVVFIAPVPPGKVEVEAKILRSGKSATHVEARIVAGAQTACLVVAIFGAPRSSIVAVAPPPARPDKSPAQSVAFPFMPGVTPDFLKYIETSWARGGAPFTGQSDPRVQMHSRLRGESAIDECSVVGMADIPPPLGLALLKKPAMGSSMTWTLEFLSHEFPQGEGWWFIDAELIAARDGYLTQSLMLYGPDGKAVALSRQAMVMFA